MAGFLQIRSVSPPTVHNRTNGQRLMASIQIIVGSVNGRAEDCARTAGALLERIDHQVEIIYEPRPNDLLRDPSTLILVCTSTTGDGELPRNLYPLFLALEDERLSLSGRQYGVIGLGDSGYPRFAAACFTLEGLLYRAGAKRLGDICTIDAQVVDNHPLEAAKWAVEWSKLIPELA